MNSSKQRSIIVGCGQRGSLAFCVFRRRKWDLAEGLPCRMAIVRCAEDPEVLRVVGSPEGDGLDVVDLEVVG